MDLLDQMELIDISEQDALDVFFSSSGEEGALTSPLPHGKDTRNKTGILKLKHVVQFSPSQCFLPYPQFKETTTTMRRLLAMDSFDTSSRASRPNLACPPLPQTHPTTARPPAPTGETLQWKGLTMRKHTPAH